MGRQPCCEKVGMKRGRWTVDEDELLTKYILANGEGSWRSLPKDAGLSRCGKSCRLRWINYLRTDLRRGNITADEEEKIIKLHSTLGNRWSIIAGHLPGRTDNEIKNYWHSHLSRKIYSYIRKPSTETLNSEIIDLAKQPVKSKRRGGRTSRANMKKNKTFGISTKTPKVSNILHKHSHDSQILSPIPPETEPLQVPLSSFLSCEIMQGDVSIPGPFLEKEGEERETMGPFMCFNDEIFRCELFGEGCNNGDAKECGDTKSENKESGIQRCSSVNSYIDDSNWKWDFDMEMGFDNRNWNLDGVIGEGDEIWGTRESNLSCLWEGRD